MMGQSGPNESSLKRELRSLRDELQASLAVASRDDAYEREPGLTYGAERGPADRTQVGGQQALLIRAVATLLDVAGSTLGECRQDTPYSPLQPVIDGNGGFSWCCSHTPNTAVGELR